MKRAHLRWHGGRRRFELRRVTFPGVLLLQLRIGPLYATLEWVR